MKTVTIFGVEEVLSALKNGKILYTKDNTIKYWMHDGIICSASCEDDCATVYLNDSIMANQDFIYYE